MVTLKDKSLFRQQCYIDGQWVDADLKKNFPVTNPADGVQLGTIPMMEQKEVNQAIQAADAALASWKRMTAKERGSILKTWFDLMMENQDDLAALMTAEQGKPLAEAKGEVAYAASFFEWFAEEGKRLYGDVIPATNQDNRIVVFKEPIGVCAAITPWNFPLAMITRKAAPALAAGCVMVLKPAGQTPYSAMALAELSRRAGLPKGVFNVVTGDSASIGKILAESPLVRKLTFTGSTEVGRRLMESCATTIKKVSLELGGNAPFIVFEDADLDAAVEGAMLSKYRNTGQTCVCANRFLVQEDIYDKFVKKLTAAVKTLKVSNGFEKDARQGPLIDMNAVEKVETHIKDAVSKGAKVITGGNRHPLGRTFFEPTVLTEVTNKMLIAEEETFGPVAPLFRFKTETDAINMANDTEYGLAAYFYCKEMSRIWRISEALEYGIVGVNTGIISNEVAPFGGMKQSGIGREGSKYGIDEFVEIKYLCMAGVRG